MGAREWTFASLLLVAGGLIVAGVAGWSGSLALVVAGVLLGLWSWGILADVGRPRP